jgi:hypothetical protein
MREAPRFKAIWQTYKSCFPIPRTDWGLNWTSS